MKKIVAIILTLNEEKNIGRCLESLRGFVDQAIIIDSFSKDNTEKIAKSFDFVRFYTNPFKSYSEQFEFGLQQCGAECDWVLRLDADECLTKDSGEEILNLVNDSDSKEVTGLMLRFQFNFLGKFLKHGGVYPHYVLRAFRKDVGKIEHRQMDEHMYVTSGNVVKCKKDCIHYSFNSIHSWIDKHNKYSDLECDEALASSTNAGVNLNSIAKNKRKAKSFYYKLPSAFRSRLYYLYRYYFLLGFLDGKAGKYYAFLQAYWYRYLVDIKLYERSIKLDE